MIKPVLSAEAVRALAHATLGGPNCSHEVGVRDLLCMDENCKLSDLAKFFHYGPDTFLATYAVINKRFELGPDDIARAYCVDHLPMVQVASKLYQEGGFSHSYFDNMRQRGFELTDKNFNRYLFSCLGRIGRIVKITQSGRKLNRAKVNSEAYYLHGSNQISLENVIVPAGVKEGQYIAIHFASGFSPVSDETAEDIIREQRKTILPLHFDNPPRKINFAKVFSQNLAEWTEKQLIPDNDEEKF